MSSPNHRKLQQTKYCVWKRAENALIFFQKWSDPAYIGLKRFECKRPYGLSKWAQEDFASLVRRTHTNTMAEL